MRININLPPRAIPANELAAAESIIRILRWGGVGLLGAGGVALLFSKIAKDTIRLKYADCFEEERK